MLKHNPKATNEVIDPASYQDQGNIFVSPVADIGPDTAAGLVRDIKKRVQEAHRNPKHLKPNNDGITRAQTFEEGDVFMAATQKPGFAPNLYLMDFFDVTKQGMCSRPHDHTGLRMVFITTGPDTSLNIASLSPIVTHDTDLKQRKDKMPGMPEGVERDRYTLTIPPNSYYTVQIPIGVSHQFNAVGPNATITSVHIEEATELKRESMDTSNMMAQTRFLTPRHPNLQECGVDTAKLLQKAGMDIAVEALSTPAQAPTPSKPPRRSKIREAVTKVGLAASLLVGSAGSAKVAYNYTTRGASDFHAKNPTALVIRNNPKSDSERGSAAYEAMNLMPADIAEKVTLFLPGKLYELAQANPEGLSDPVLVAWAADKVTLRKMDGIIDPSQVVFQYDLNRDGVSHIHSVTAREFAQEMGKLKELMAPGKKIAQTQQIASR